MNEDTRQDIVVYRMGKAYRLLHEVDILRGKILFFGYNRKII